MASIHHPWIFTFGLLGNLISFMVYLAPLPTFMRICKKKSTEGFQSIPYIFALFSAMLWVYYGLLKSNSVLLITINTVGCVIEAIYVALYLTYAPKPAKVHTLMLLVFLNLGGFCLIIFLCHYFVKGPNQAQVVGWICVAFSTVVFVAPLSVMRLVIRTKSVEFMPFSLSLSLTLSAIFWFMYGMLKKDLYVVLPNISGFIFGVAQMVLYGVYRNYDKFAVQNQKLPEELPTSAKLSTISMTTAAEIHPMDFLREVDEIKEEYQDQDLHDEHESSNCRDGIKIDTSCGSSTIQLVECSA